jgi:hypothetical protein
VTDDKDTVERAKELLVYGPVGFALYLRDTAPSFMKVFVARGRAELDEKKRSVGGHLGQARTVGQDTVGQSASAGAAPQVMRIVSDGLGKVRETAEGALGALSALSADIAAPPASSGASSASQAAAPERGPVPTAAAPEPTAKPPTAPEPGTSASTIVAGSAPGLAIPDYDELSASQVVDRLDGLAPSALDSIRAYETAHRGRATILGKIDQLGQAG